MAEVIISEDEEDEGLEDVAVQAAAVQQGVATVRAEQAAEAAAAAEVAAEMAGSAVGTTVEASAQAQEAAQVAVEGANVSVAAVEALTAAIERQSALLESMQQNMSQAQVSPPVPAERKKKTADRVPETQSKKKRTFADRYYGR